MNIIASRVFNYVVYGLMFYAAYKIVSFEFMACWALGTIIGEIHHQQSKNNPK
jgi:hypothetical protein